MLHNKDMEKKDRSGRNERSEMKDRRKNEQRGKGKTKKQLW